MEASGSAESKLRDQISRKGRDTTMLQVLQLKPKVGRTWSTIDCRTDQAHEPAKPTLLLFILGCTSRCVQCRSLYSIHSAATLLQAPMQAQQHSPEFTALKTFSATARIP